MYYFTHYSHYLSSIQGLFLIFGVVFFVAAIVIGIIAVYTLRRNVAIKYEFITIIAHKFRTPLSHIKYISEALLESEKDSLQIGNIKELRTSNDQLIGLTGTLIELAESKKDTKTSYTFEGIPLCEIVKNVSDSVRISFQEKNISFSVECPAQEVDVLCDRNRLEFVLEAVLENAYTYTPSGGKVAVIIRSSHRKASIFVTDNGIGIENKDIHHIFSKFHRAKNARAYNTEGMGVGLFMAKKIMKRLHGKIKAFSAGKDKGSTFKIILPTDRRHRHKHERKS
jgi:signal transduction histidine kinase